MTDTTAEDITPRNQYFAIITFKNPVQTTINVAAKDLEDAKRIIVEYFKHQEDLTIVDIYDIREAPVEPIHVDADTPKVLN